MAFDWSSVIGAGITGVAGLVGNWTKPDTTNFGGTEAGFNQSLALEYAQLAQQASTARDNIAAQLQAAGMSAKAAIEVANIQAGAMLKKARMEAALGIGQMREKAMADKIAQQIEAKKGNPQLALAANQNVIASRAGVGQAAQQGFQGAANVLSAFRRG